jgi:hypothetical protein
MTETTGVMTTGVTVATTSVTTDKTIDAMIDVAKTTTTATTIIRRTDSTATAQRWQPQWCVPIGQPRDQLHRWRPPSD